MLSIFILIVSTTLLCLLLVGISYFFAPRETNSKIKAGAYECGIQPEEKANSQISVKFFLTALLFILFDIEIIFLYPFALAYREILELEQGLSILLGMGLFFADFYLWALVGDQKQGFKLEINYGN